MKKRTQPKSTVEPAAPLPPPLPPPVSPTELTDVHRDLFDRLRPFEVSVSEAWGRHATPATVYPGRCYDRSFCFLMEYALALGLNAPPADTWLVYGEYWFIQRHAWVELPGGVVFDGPYQRFYDRAGYYEAVDARPWYMYSPRAASLIAAWMPRYPDGTIPLGDWHDRLGLPWADPANPTRIGCGEAARILVERGLMPRSFLPERRRKTPHGSN